MIKKGDTVEIKREWQDEGDDQLVYIAADDEEKGRVTIEALTTMFINPTQVVKVEWLVSK
jgi:hypothetical protein